MWRSGLPKTSLGKWSVSLAIVCIMLLVLLMVLIGQSGMERGSVVANILGISLIISGIAALVTGLISIIKAKERSILAFLAVVVTGLFDLFALFMFIGEEFFQ